MVQKKVVNKKKKLIKTRLFSLIFSFVFIVSLFMGVAVMAQSSPLKLNKVTIFDKSANVTGKIVKYSKDDMKNNITFHKLNDYVTYKLVIKNNSKDKLTILSITDDNSNKYVQYQYDQHKNEKVVAGNMFELYVKAIYKKELNDITKRQQNDNVKFTINYLIDGKEKKDTIVINPKTGDNINISFILLCLSSVGLITCFVVDKRRNKEKISKLSMLMIVSILLTPVVVKAATLSYDITFRTNISLYDKMVVTYVVNGKEKTLTVPYGNLITGLENPTKKGYTFDKWIQEDGKVFDFSKPIKEDIKIKAKFNIETYQINYDLDGGTTSSANPSTYTVEDRITLIEPTKQYYVFKGWEGTDLSGPTKNVVIKNKTGDRSYVAEYEPKSYTITYNGLTSAEKSSLNNPTTYNIETSSFTLNNPSNRTDEDGDTTYIFNGWKEGTTTSTTITLPDSSMGNKTYEAVWTEVAPEVYSISYELNGGTVETDNPTEFTKKTETFTLNNPSKTGYTFKGWSGTDLTGDENTTVKVVKGTKKSLSFEAHYNANTYTVKFNKNVESATGTMSSQLFTYDTLGKLTDIGFERVGYTFDSWNTEADGTGTAYANKDDVLNVLTEGEITLYAQWTPNTYEIKFIGNHESVTGEMSNLSMVYDETKVLTLNEFSVTRYIFDGWNTKSDGTGSSYVNGASVKNLTTSGTVKLYAQWRLKSYLVSFDTDEGSSVNPIEVDVGDQIGTLPTTTKENYIFAGWYLNLTDSDPIDNTYTPSADVTLHAKWNKVVCKKATVLTSEACESASGTGCRAAGYASGEEIVYGNIVSSDNYVSGDALYCDVDGTGYNQRFYYLRTVDNKAVLISNNNYEGTAGQKNENNFVYADAHDKLPTTTQWNKLPVSFDGKAARLITIDDLKAASGKTNVTGTGALDNVNYLFENSSYAHSSGRSTQWIEEHEDGTRSRYHKNNRNVLELNVSDYDSSKNCVRPVIEVPLNLIDDTYVVRYNPNGGTVDNEYVAVKKGSSLGTLSTATKEGYAFDKWYTSPEFTTEVTEDTIPNGYDTYYARWISYVENAELDSTSFTLETGSSDRIIINNVSNLEPYTFESSDSSIVSVDSDGVMTALSEGETTIIIKGLTSNTTKTINVKVLAEVTEYTITFDTQGGSSVAAMVVAKNTAIGTLPTSTKTDYDLGGWFTNTSYSKEVTAETIVTNDMTLFAKWIPSDAVAEINNTYYTTVQAAVDAADTTKTTIKLLKDVTNTAIIDLFTKNTDKNIVLDLQGHSITNNTTNVIRTKATLEIKNGILNSSAASGAVDVGSGGKLVMNSGSIIATGSRQAIYNDGGTVEIGGNIELSAKPDVTSSNFRATVQNISGTLKITGGNIVSNKYAVTVTGGTFILGEKDDAYDKTTPVLQGDINGIYSTVNYSVYDGIIKGQTAAVNNESKITSIEDGSTKVNSTEEIGGSSYNTLYYDLISSKHKVIFDPNGGTVSPSYITVNHGDPVGTLPVPERGAYTFDGWWTGINDGVQVNENTVPSANVTYHARWHYEASDNIVNFNMTNDVMGVYYDNIDTWKTDETTFQDNMNNNFNNFNCKCNENTCSTSGTELCDKPKGYETGFTDSINVYESDENTKVKGSLVTYTTSTNGIIYNMIPGETYYWESATDSSIYGYVKVSGKRRVLNINGVRNVRDLGGLKVDSNGDGTIDGTLKYGKIFRGERLYSDTNNVTQLAKVGINEEIDLRASSEIPSTEAQFSNFKHREIKHYQIDYATQLSNYNLSRNMAIEAMQDVIDGKNIYFHCRIGTDRTGTLAYILEGLLGVNKEEMLEDYELSYFFGLVNRHRFYSYDPKSSVSKDQKFVYMYNLMSDADGVYDWFMLGSTDPDADNALINQFKNAMIDSY